MPELHTDTMFALKKRQSWSSPLFFITSLNLFCNKHGSLPVSRSLNSTLSRRYLHPHSTVDSDSSCIASVFRPAVSLFFFFFFCCIVASSSRQVSSTLPSQWICFCLASITGTRIGNKSKSFSLTYAFSFSSAFSLSSYLFHSLLSHHSPLTILIFQSVSSTRF